MKSLNFIKTNQLYLFVSLFFMAGSVGLSMIEMSMNLYILFNGLLLVGIPAVFLTYRYKGEKGLKETVRFNKVSFKTVLYSVLIPIVIYPIIMLCNAIVILLLPEVPTELNNQALVVSIAIGFQILGLGLFPGFFEELLFRGVLIRGLENQNRHFAIIYIAFLFALLHLNPYNFVGPFILGIVFGYMLYASNSIIPSMIAHMTNNMIGVTMIFISTKLQALIPEEEATTKGTMDIAMADIPIASIIISGFILLGLAFGSYFLTRLLLRKMKEEQEKNVESKIEEEIEETHVLVKKEKWSFLYIAPMIIIFIAVFFTI
jgi:uncharacterized protein